MYGLQFLKDLKTATPMATLNRTMQRQAMTLEN